MAKNKRKKFDTGEGNLDMIKNSVTAIKHHADELTAELKKNPEIEAWVLAKVDRAAQNLSDVTHYLDGEMNKFAKGGKTPVIRTQFEEEEFEYAKGGEFKPYGKTKGRYKIEYVQDGEKQSEVWESKEMVEDRGKKLLKLGCTDIKITEVKKMAKGGEPKPSLIPDYKKISNVEVEDIDRDDYPDFSDAYISYAEYDGEPMTDEQLEELNQDGLFVYDAIHSRLFADGGMMADGEVGEGFLIRDMREKLNRMFPDTFGFTVGNVSKEGNKTLNSAALIVDLNDPYRGLEDKDIQSKLFFPQYKRDHNINFRVMQGGENTYFYFALESEKGDEYIGQFGFKDSGDVPSSYITRFIAFLMEQYGLPFDVKHSIMADGGMMARGGKVKSKRWIQDALTGNKGALRRTAKRKGLIKGDEKLSKSDLNKLEKMGGKTARRARLAETLIDFKK